ncbi:hypothetical protein BLAT2472_90274 [Burkholderia latens]
MRRRPEAGQSSGFFLFRVRNRFPGAFYRNGTRRNKLLLYGEKSGIYYAPVFSLNLINYRTDHIFFPYS